MASELVLSGVTFSGSVAKALPVIPDLLALGFFGSGYDGINTNRAPGGPAFGSIGNVPIFSSNYLTVGPGVTASGWTITRSGNAVSAVSAPTIGGTNYGGTVAPIFTFSGGGGSGASATPVVSGGAVTGFTSIVGGTGYTSDPTGSIFGGNISCLDLGTPRSDLLTSGWTTALVCRVPASGGPCVLASDKVQSGNPIGFGILWKMQNVNTNHSSTPTLSIDVAAQDNAWFSLLSSATQWRFVTLTYAGTGTGVFTMRSLSDDLSATYTNASLSAASSQQMHLGADPYGTSTQGNPDVAFAMQCGSVLDLTTQQNVYVSVKSLLARRGITVL